MKGKIKKFSKLIFLMVAFLTIGICFSFGVRPTKENVHAALQKVTINGEEYSAKFDEEVIFSVEKVLVNADDEYSEDEPNKKYKTPLQNSNCMYVRDDESADGSKYYYKDISTGSQTKTVVGDGEFVMLNQTNETALTTSSASVHLKQALMISFGQYVFGYDSERNTDTVSLPSDKADSITAINIALYVNGVQQTDIPGYRNTVDPDTGAIYLDFAFLLTESKFPQGQYRFNIDYMKNSVAHSATFEFYLLFESSYNQEVKSSHNHAYNTFPTLGWMGNDGEYNRNLSQGQGGYIDYRIGADGVGDNYISYPTLTYDYTKYKLNYTYSCNGEVIYYDYSCETSAFSNGTAKMVITSTGAENRIKQERLLSYNSSNSNNIVTLVLTEQGTYNFSFSYLYSGYGHENISSEDMNLKIDDINLKIHGFELKYSKLNYLEAELRYYEIEQDNFADKGVDVIVPNGHKIDNEDEISSRKNDNLYLIYEFVNKNTNATNYRAGTVVNLSTDGENGSLDALTRGIDVSSISSISSSVNNIKFIKTNQGSLWLSRDTDTYDSTTSYYYYSSNEITYDSFYGDGALTQRTYSPQTSFNKVGYYLVILKVKPTNMNEEDTYCQVFAFEYTTSVINTDTQEYDKDNASINKIIGKNGYTNQDIKVTWKEPGIFEKKLTCYYYGVVDENAEESVMYSSLASKISNGTALVVENGGTLPKAENGHFVKYLIRLKSEGSSLTNKIVTCDRQSISGIATYVVEQGYAGTSKYYSLKTNGIGSFIKIENYITDSFAALDWNYKASGARIDVNYTFTPFSKDVTFNNNTEDNVINIDTRTRWLKTNYKLGTTIASDNLYKINPNSIDEFNVLNEQGIYIFNLKDVAGNESSYILIIDKTPSFVKIDNNLYSNDSVIFKDTISYDVGSYKAIDIDIEDVENTTVKSFITNCATGNREGLIDLNYADANNTSAINQLKNLFKINDNKYYFTVANYKVAVFDKGEEIKFETLNVKTSGSSSQITKPEKGKSSNYRTLYIVGENNRYGATDVWNRPDRSKSYLNVEINTDNAMGMAYYSDVNLNDGDIPTDGNSTETIFKLRTGQNINEAFATSSNYLAFTLLMGSGDYEIKSVSYKFYELNLSSSSYNSSLKANGNDPIQYYNYVESDSKKLYDNYQKYDNTKIENGRLTYVFNSGNQASEGLYIVTREYKNELDSTDSDETTLSYYFIVDRKGIVDGEVGKNIGINLLENETFFNSFNQVGGEYSILKYNDKEFGYYTYLTTSKVPAVLKIPAGKFYTNKDQNSASYYAGQLYVRVFYYDIYNQLSTSKQDTRLIFESTGDFAITKEGVVNSDGMINIDIKAYLNTQANNDINSSFANYQRLFNSDGKWLSLPGKYIVVINDHVDNTLGTNNTFAFAFDVKNSAPNIEIESGFVASNDVEDLKEANVQAKDDKRIEYNLITSDEIIKLHLPAYDDEDAKNAQIDVTSLEVTQISQDGSFIYLQGKDLDKNLVTSSIVKKDETTGKYFVYLDTKLRKENGEIDIEGFNKPLTYIVKISYKLINGNSNYTNCYKYYINNEIVYYHTTTYVINIDRVAPQENVNNLILSEINANLVQDYTKQINKNIGLDKDSELFTLNYHSSGSTIYFTNEYQAYYKSVANRKTDSGLIYAFKVNPTSPYCLDDIDKVGIMKLESISNVVLSLPVLTQTFYNVDNTMLTYGSLLMNILSTTNDGYYVVIEQDKAGNTTQYVIYFSDGETKEDLLIPITAKDASKDGQTDHTLGFGNNVVKNGDTVIMFDVFEKGITTVENERFFYIELKNRYSNVSTSFVTGFGTDFNTLSSQIVTMIKNMGIGQYSLTIKSHTQNYLVYIEYLDRDLIPTLNIEKIVIKQGNNYYLILDGSNERIDGIYYYARKISVIYNGDRFEYRYSNESYKLYAYNNASENVDKYDYVCDVNNQILCEAGTYQVKATNIIEEETQPVRFDTVEGNVFDEIIFGDFDAPNNYYFDGETYYGFNKATIKFSSSLFFVDDESLISYCDEKYSYIVLEPDFGNEVTKQVVLKDKDTEEAYKVYNVVIDTRTINLTLTDFQGLRKNLVNDYNVDLQNVKAESIASGDLNLSWYWNNQNVNENFVYKYLLYKRAYDETEFESTDLTYVTSTIIRALNEDPDEYRFEIQVYSIDGDLLGNRAYAFEVQSQSGNLYRLEGETVTFKSNENQTTFKMSELGSLLPIALISQASNNQNYRLYITNEDLNVILTEGQNIELNGPYSPSALNLGYNFKIYHLTVGDYNVYFGILKINKTDILIQNFKVNDVAVTDKTLNQTIADDVQLEWELASIKNDVLDSKNNLILQIYYNGQFVKEEEFASLSTMKYDVLGNGNYEFVFKDMAGNVHKFIKYSDGTYEKDFRVTVLREVVVLINEEVPIENAYYNGTVEMRIYASTNYVTGTIKVSATRNGEKYSVGNISPYTFSTPGTYRVQVSAYYGEKELTKTIVFTIINPKEARQSIDLSNLYGYDLKFTDSNGNDVTSAFNEILNANRSQAMLLTYDKVVDYAQNNPNSLSINAGKLTYTIEYIVKDEIYPVRSLNFSFALNDEVPTISCSINPGESTEKGFSISFNAAIIYDQIGEAKIYINNKLVADINENSASEITKITTTFKKDGAGDYYIKLESSSGTVLTSFKVTIKEPLNAWAIIIIVIVVAVVITVTTIIIVLRHKMKIR